MGQILVCSTFSGHRCPHSPTNTRPVFNVTRTCYVPFLTLTPGQSAINEYWESVNYGESRYVYGKCVLVTEVALKLFRKGSDDASFLRTAAAIDNAAVPALQLHTLNLLPARSRLLSGFPSAR